MTFKAAAAFICNVGNKFKGKSLDKIAETDEGLLYLDWLLGCDWLKAMKFLNFRLALNVYMRDESIAKEVRALAGQARDFNDEF